MNRRCLPLVLWFAAAPIAGKAQMVDANVRGVVTDTSGRPLPFVVVTSRTSNGFLSSWSDLRGHFQFPGRPHAPNGVLTFKSAGYDTALVRVREDTAFHPVTLRPNRSSAVPGWTIGLIDDPTVLLLSAADEIPVHPDSVVSGRRHRIVIRSRDNPTCRRTGPGNMGIDSTFVTVAVTVYVRGSPCNQDSPAVEWQFDVVFERIGLGEIRTIGRYGDFVVPVRIIPDRAPGSG